MRSFPAFLAVLTRNAFCESRNLLLCLNCPINIKCVSARGTYRFVNNALPPPVRRTIRGVEAFPEHIFFERGESGHASSPEFRLPVASSHFRRRDGSQRAGPCA